MVERRFEKPRLRRFDPFSCHQLLEPDVLSFPHVKTLLTWQLVDKYSWLIPKGQKRPLPFDDNYQPKPMAFEIERALQSRRAG